MPMLDTLQTLFHRFEVHVFWAAALVVVAVLVKAWPAIKAKAASGWARVKAVFRRDEAEVKAVLELTDQLLEAVAGKVRAAVAADVDGVKARLETLEQTVTARIAAQMAADTAARETAQPPSSPMESAPNIVPMPAKGWEPPAPKG